MSNNLKIGKKHFFIIVHGGSFFLTTFRSFHLEGRYLSFRSFKLEYEIAKRDVIKRFVGRETELGIFERYLEGVILGDIPLKIVQIEGKEGIGKTWLLLRIKYEYESKVPVVYVDLRDYYLRGNNLRALLRDIAKKLRAYGFKTERFDIVNTLYLRVRCGTTWSRGEGITSEYSTIARLIPRMRRLIRAPEIIANHGDKLQELIEEKFGEKSGWFIGMFGENYGESLLRLLIDDPEKYVYVMAEALRADVVDIAESTREKAVILLLDSYEFLQNATRELTREETHEGSRRITDEDILILFLMRLRRSLVIVAGQQKISWEKRFSPLRDYIGRGKIIERFSLEELAEDYVDRYLNIMGIENPETKHVVRSLVGGHPLLLSCVVGGLSRGKLTPIEIKTLRGRTVRDILGDIFQRIMSRLDENEQQIFIATTILSRFDTKVLEKIIPHKESREKAVESITELFKWLGILEPPSTSKEPRKLHRVLRSMILEISPDNLISSVRDKILQVIWQRYKHGGNIEYAIEAINIEAEVDEEKAFRRYLEIWEKLRNKYDYEYLDRLYKETKFVDARIIIKKNLHYAMILREEARYDRAEKILLEALKNLPLTPKNRVDIGYAQYILGTIYRDLGRFRDAEEALRTAIGAYIGALSYSGEREPQILENLGDTLMALGSMYMELGRYDEAEGVLRESVNNYRKILKIKSKVDPRILGNLGEALMKLGAMYRDLERYSDAEHVLIESIDSYRKALEVAAKRDPRILNSLGNALSLLGTIYRETGKYREAEEKLLEALDVYRDALRRMRWKSPVTWNNMGYVQSELAAIYRKLGRYKEAEKALKEAIRFYKKALSLRDWRIAKVWSRLGIAQSELGLIYRIQRRYDDAEKLFKEAIRSYREALTLRREDIRTLERLGATQSELGIVYRVQRRYYEAEKLFKEAIKSYEKLLREETDNPVVLNNLGYAKSMLGEIFIELRRYDEAEKILEDAIDIYKRALSMGEGRSPIILNNLGFTLTMLGISYREIGRYNNAIETLKDATRIYREALDIVSWNDPTILCNLGNTLSELGVTYRELEKFDDAKKALKEAIESYRKALELTGWRDPVALNNLGTTQYLLGVILRSQNEYIDAEDALKKAVDAYRKAVDLTEERSAVAWSNLGSAQSLLGEVYMDLYMFKRALKLFRESLSSFDRANSITGNRYYYPLFRICFVKIRICDALCMLGKCGLDDYWFTLEKIAEFHSRFRMSEYTSFLLYMLIESARKNGIRDRYIGLLIRRMIMLSLPLASF